MHTMDELIGTVDRFLFQSDDNGFSVFVLALSQTESVTIKGYAPGIHAGEYVTVAGSWVMHPKFGKQFEAQRCTASPPTSTAGLIRYLSSGLIKGIGPVYAEKLVNHFGSTVLEVIDKEPHRLAQVTGIGPGRVTKIINGWKDQKEISSIMVFLQDKNISPSYALKIYKQYGQNAINVVQENPYRLADDIWGIGFKIADQIALNLGIAQNSPERIRAGILYAITTAIGNGHLYVELEELRTTTAKLIEVDLMSIETTIKQALHTLYNQEKIKLISHEGNHYITLSQYYYSERGIASKIKRLQEYPVTHTFDIEAVYAQLRAPKNERDIMLNEEQQQGIMACLQHKVTIITGGPGTGKTTLIKALLNILDANKLVYKLAAPTGRAAKRITEGTGRQAATLHRLLEFDFATHSFTHNENNALQLNFLIVDEASMIDVFLGHALLKALPLHAHVLLIGDVDQLPSVGAGNFLNDLIASKKVTSVRLQQIFRQAQDSLIITNAHRINNGEFPVSYAPDAKQDFVFIKEDNPEMVSQHLRTIYTQKLARYGIAKQDAIVLVPMNRGAVGTQALNHSLQEILNPNTQGATVARHGTTFKVRDRVMQIRNNYDKFVFNGDIGTIEAIDPAEQKIMVNFYDKPMEYEFSELDELVLAYAVTIHKSQGSEYAAAIIPIFMQHFALLQRNLIYTAITRAKKLCIFIGQTKAVGMAIRNNKGVERTTFLQEFLTTDLEAR
jgi:exodeoxyribonuclease V alpha subunit